MNLTRAFLSIAYKCLLRRQWDLVRTGLYLIVLATFLDQDAVSFTLSGFALGIVCILPVITSSVVTRLETMAFMVPMSVDFRIRLHWLFFASCSGLIGFAATVLSFLWTARNPAWMPVHFVCIFLVGLAGCLGANLLSYFTSTPLGSRRLTIILFGTALFSVYLVLVSYTLDQSDLWLIPLLLLVDTLLALGYARFERRAEVVCACRSSPAEEVDSRPATEFLEIGGGSANRPPLPPWSRDSAPVLPAEAHVAGSTVAPRIRAPRAGSTSLASWVWASLFLLRSRLSYLALLAGSFLVFALVARHPSWTSPYDLPFTFLCLLMLLLTTLSAAREVWAPFLSTPWPRWHAYLLFFVLPALPCVLAMVVHAPLQSDGWADGLDSTVSHFVRPGDSSWRALDHEGRTMDMAKQLSRYLERDFAVSATAKELLAVGSDGHPRMERASADSLPSDTTLWLAAVGRRYRTEIEGQLHARFHRDMWILVCLYAILRLIESAPLALGPRWLWWIIPLGAIALFFATDLFELWFTFHALCVAEPWLDLVLAGIPFVLAVCAYRQFRRMTLDGLPQGRPGLT